VSLRHEGPWHYEYIGARTEKQWRVADVDDDPVQSFDTENEAICCVREHNATHLAANPNWKTGISDLNAPQIMRTLKEVQDRLPEYWTDENYPHSFNQAPLPHRHFNHALTHAMKALGSLAALSDAMDHERTVDRGYVDLEAAQFQGNAGKWLADLVICAAKMADQIDIDLDENVQHRINMLIKRWSNK